MEHSAIPGARRVSTELALYAGRTASQDSVMTVLSALNLSPMAVAPDMFSGMKTSATEKIQMSAVKSGEPCGIPSARLTSTMLLAVSAHPTAPLTRPTLASHVPSNLTAVVLAMFCNANLS